jgi:hypothetical protein
MASPAIAQDLRRVGLAAKKTRGQAPAASADLVHPVARFWKRVES